MNDYLVWSNEHRAWWGRDHTGYTTSLSAAGRYSRDEALRICGRALGTALHIGVLAELPVRAEDVKAFLAGGLIPAGLA